MDVLAVWNAGPAGLAGVYAWGRMREKLAAVTDAVPGVVGAGDAGGGEEATVIGKKLPFAHAKKPQTLEND